jgi:hypothetical protein
LPSFFVPFLLLSFSPFPSFFSFPPFQYNTADPEQRGDISFEIAVPANTANLALVSFSKALMGLPERQRIVSAIVGLARRNQSVVAVMSKAVQNSTIIPAMLSAEAIFTLWKWYRGEITGKRCAATIVNMLVSAAGGVGGGMAGAAIGTAISPGNIEKRIGRGMSLDIDYYTNLIDSCWNSCGSVCGELSRWNFSQLYIIISDLKYIRPFTLCGSGQGI